MARVLVVQDLVVLQCRATGPTVAVRVVTPAGRVHHVHLTFADEAAAFAQAWVVEGWRRHGTPVTYVRGPHQGALVDDAAAFRAAMEPEAA